MTEWLAGGAAPGSGPGLFAPGRQRHPARACAFAHDVKPAFFAVDLDRAECGLHQFARSQARRVREVQHEAQALCGGRLPAVGPLQPVSHRTQQRPFDVRKRSGGVHGGRHDAAHLDASERVGQQVALLDQPAEQGAKHRQAVRGGSRRQRARKRPPLRR